MIWEIGESARTVEGLDPDGRPRPEYAASLGLLPAPTGRRVLAAAVELAVLAALQLPWLLGALPALLAVAAAPDPQAALGAREDLGSIAVWLLVSAGLTAVFVVVQLVLHGRRGVTLGKAITGIRSVDVRTLGRPGFWRGAVVRYLVLWASTLVPVVGPILVVAVSPLLDREGRGRGWPDLAAATWFVDARRGLDPYDAKRMRIARKTAATELSDERPVLPSLATPHDAHGPDVSIPLARSSGGVLGAPTPGAARPGAARPDAPASAGAPAPAPEWPVSPFEEALLQPAPLPLPRVAPAPPAAPAEAWAPPVLLPDSPAADPAAEPPASEPASRASARVHLVLDTGEMLAVAREGILLGRAPTPGPEESGLTPVRIVDRTMSVSKSHVAIVPTATGYAVVERGSTNGSVVVRAGTERPLVPGEPVALADGDTLRFGDRHATVRID